MNISLKEIPLEFEVERKYRNDFGSEVRKFRIVKAYDNFVLYKCYKKNKKNEEVHLFYECFSYSYLWNKEYETNNIF